MTGKPKRFTISRPENCRFPCSRAASWSTIVAAAFFIYTADYYHSDSSAADALVSDSRVTVEQPDGNLVFTPASEPG